MNVTAVGQPGSAITINGRASLERWAGQVSLAPVKDGSQTEQYWVRCLPPGFARRPAPGGPPPLATTN
ncbi:MAG: hypothetical protein WCG47_04010 [Dermatophilaceae bacterium]